MIYLQLVIRKEKVKIRDENLCLLKIPQDGMFANILLTFLLATPDMALLHRNSLSNKNYAWIQLCFPHLTPTSELQLIRIPASDRHVSGLSESTEDLVFND